MKNILLFRKYRYAIGFILLVLGYITFSLYYNDYPLFDGESQRDYLIIHTMVTNHEFPLAGRNSGLYPLRNSPLQYYIFYPFIAIHDSFRMYQIINVLIQGINIGLIACLGTIIFSQSIGLLAAFFFSISSQGLIQASYPWPPYFAPPFMHGALITLLLFRRSKRIVWMIISIIAISASLSLHYSNIAFIPFYIILYIQSISLGALSVKQKRMLTILVIALIIIFGGSMLYASSQDIFLYFRGYTGSTVLVSNIFTAPILLFQGILPAFLKVWFFDLSTHIGIFTYSLSITMITGLLYRIRIKALSDKEKLGLWICYVGILTIFIIVSMVSPAANNMSVNLTPSFGLFMILLSYIVLTSFSPYPFVKGILILSMIFILHQGYSLQLIQNSGKQYQSIRHIIIPAVMKQIEASTLRDQTSSSSPLYIDYYRFDPQQGTAEANAFTSLILLPLFPAKYLHSGHVVNNDIGYILSRNNDMIFLACAFFTSEKTLEELCIRPFIQKHSYYAMPRYLTKTEAISLYVTKKIQ